MADYAALVFEHDPADGEPAKFVRVRTLTRQYVAQLQKQAPPLLCAVYGPLSMAEIRTIPDASLLPKDRLIWQRSTGTT